VSVGGVLAGAGPFGWRTRRAQLAGRVVADRVDPETLAVPGHCTTGPSWRRRWTGGPAGCRPGVVPAKLISAVRLGQPVSVEPGGGITGAAVPGPAAAVPPGPRASAGRGLPPSPPGAGMSTQPRRPDDLDRLARCSGAGVVGEPSGRSCVRVHHRDTPGSAGPLPAAEALADCGAAAESSW